MIDNLSPSPTALRLLYSREECSAAGKHLTMCCTILEENSCVIYLCPYLCAVNFV